MTNPPTAPAKPAQPSREERLAAKLRENLHRRKAQSRTMDSRAMETDPPLNADHTPNTDSNPALPKAPPKS